MLMSIYTGSGDQCNTVLGSSKRIRKSSIRIEASGNMDELNSWLGLIAAHMKTENPETQRTILKIQNDLHKILAEISNPLKKFEQIAEEDVRFLEKNINEVEKELPPLEHFILPGGSKTSSLLHIARTVCRRTERRVVRLAETEIVNKTILIYLNRLSDFLFVFARKINAEAREQEREPIY